MNENKETYDLVLGAFAATTKYYEDMFEVDENSKKVKAVAKKFCINDGRQPEDIVMGYGRQPPQVGAKGNAIIFAPVQPSWVLYVPEAKLFFELAAEMGVK